VSIAALTGWPVSIGYEPAAAAVKIKLKRLSDELIEEEDDLHPKIASLVCRRRCAAIVLGVIPITTVWATSRLASSTALPARNRQSPDGRNFPSRCYLYR